MDLISSYFQTHTHRDMHFIYEPIIPPPFQKSGIR